MTSMTSLRRPNAEGGVSAVEYAILVSLIAAAIIGIVVIVGGEVGGLYDTVTGKF